MPRIYRISYCHSDEGSCLEWAGSMKEAKKLVNRIKVEDIVQAQDTYADSLARDLVEDGITYHVHKKVDHEDISVDPVDFPTKKQDIITWLNWHFVRDNG